MTHLKISPLALLLSLSATLLPSAQVQAQEQTWGVGAVSRFATIPFDLPKEDKNVNTFVPMLFFNNDYVFMDGTEGGLFLYNDDASPWRVSAITRLRFIDIPKDAQNQIGGDKFDFGGQVRYQLNQDWFADAELMSDTHANYHSNLRFTGDFQTGALSYQPHVTFRFKSADFNSTYYSSNKFTDHVGLPQEHIGAGVDVNLGIKAKYHVYSNLYLLGSTSVTYLDHNAYSSAAVNDRYEGEVMLGFGFFNKPQVQKHTEHLSSSHLKSKPFIRIGQGFATPSNMGDILSFNGEKDEHNNQLTSILYGHPLADDLFDIPLQVYLTPGIAHHWHSSVQSASTEYMLGIKAYYTFNWPTQWRFSVSEGLSYVDSITYIEGKEMDEKGYNPSKLLNYLDFSFDVNLGSLTKTPAFNDVWLGYAIHHRSAIFEKSSQFGRIKGGSNYNVLYVQYGF